MVARYLRWWCTVSVCLLLVAGGLAAIGAGAAAAAGARPAKASVSRSCAGSATAHAMRCMALRRNDIRGKRALAVADLPDGYGPADLQDAYRVPTSPVTRTVAIVDAFDDPTAEADLAVYRAQYGLPPCTAASGCFRKVNQSGAATPLPIPDAGWSGEISLDLDMVSAICPTCPILLIEANTNENNDLYTAEDTAAAMAHYVSNSWDGPEYPGETADDVHFTHPGVAITVASGDNGNGAMYPATARGVTTVGGTTLNRDSTVARGWSESAWLDAGSGCSVSVPIAPWQNTDTGCTARAEADVAAVADPFTGVAVYQNFGGSGWAVFGGTSAATPIIAAMYALAGAPGSGDFPAAYPYAHPTGLFDVTDGVNGVCTPAQECEAGPGWDGPTGLGTPDGTTAFTPPTGGPNVVFVTDPGDQMTNSGTPVRLRLSASDSGGATLTYRAGGLPPGLTLDPVTGLITGTPTTAGTFPVTVTVSDGTGVSDHAGFAWTILVPGGGIANGGFESGLTGWDPTGSVSTITSPVHGGSAAAQLGSTVVTGDSTLTQTFAVGPTTGRLTFWYRMTCPSDAAELSLDWFTGTLTDFTTGTTSTVLEPTCTTDDAYHPVAAVVVPGHVETLTLTSHDDGGLAASTDVDDVTLSTPVVASITNGGFESGLDGWNPTGSATTITSPVHSGQNAARLGSTAFGAPTSAGLTQIFDAPGTATQLSFWYQMSCAFDGDGESFTATLTDTTTSTSATLVDTCTQDSAYHPVLATVIPGHRYVLTLDLADLLQFGNTVDIDDVALSAAAPTAITNGGFESKLSGWTVTGGVKVVTTPVHGGTRAAVIGTGTQADSALTQTFTVTSGSFLAVWYQMRCGDSGSDTFSVTLADLTAGTTDTVGGNVCSFDSAYQGQWAAVTAGHRYTLTLTNHNGDPSLFTSETFVDDITTS